MIGCWGSAQVQDRQPAAVIQRASGLRVDSKTNVVGADITVSQPARRHRHRRQRPRARLRPAPHGERDAARPATTRSQPDAGEPVEHRRQPRRPIGVGFVGFNRRSPRAVRRARSSATSSRPSCPTSRSSRPTASAASSTIPTAAGRQDSPIADAIETTLAGISIAGPSARGSACSSNAPLFDVAEDTVGITFGADSRFTRERRQRAPGSASRRPGAPEPDRVVLEAARRSRPSGRTTPVRQRPYGVGIAISTAGFNQLLRGADRVRPHAHVAHHHRPRRRRRRAAAADHVDAALAPRARVRAAAAEHAAARRHRADAGADRHRQRRARAAS